MKILKRGKIPIKIVFTVKCWCCKSKLEYEHNDVIMESVSNQFVECPVCEVQIKHYIEPSFVGKNTNVKDTTNVFKKAKPPPPPNSRTIKEGEIRDKPKSYKK